MYVVKPPSVSQNFSRIMDVKEVQTMITPKDLSKSYDVEFDNSGSYNWDTQAFEYSNDLDSSYFTMTGRPGLSGHRVDTDN